MRVKAVFRAIAVSCCMAVLPASAAPNYTISDQAPADLPRIANVRQLTSGPKAHFCNYYGVCPWDAAGRRLICMESEVDGREVAPEDTAGLCLVDEATGELREIARTAAWNFQQGSLACWLGTDPNRLVIYNDLIDGKLTAVILDVESGGRRALPRPVAAVSNDGKLAASISYARMNKTRRGYGYIGANDPASDLPHPEDDGLYVMDTATGDCRLIVSLDRLFKDQTPPEDRKDDTIFINHVQFSPDGTRLFFIPRYNNPVGSLLSSGYTVGADGSDLRCVIPYAWNCSHYDWRAPNQIMVSTRFQGRKSWLHVLFTDGLQDHAPVAPELLSQDGHCHFSQDGRWLVSDSYPSGPERMQRFFLGDMKTGRVAEAGRFHHPESFKRDWRCDLHPRWSRDGRRICIDSVCDGTRQVYILEIALPEN